MSLHQLAQLFKPRDPVEYLKPYPEQIGKKRPLPYTGVAWCVSALESKEEYEEIMQTWKPIEQRKERRIRVASERKESSAVKVQEALERWNPSGYVFDSDAYKTLFVGRLSYLTDEHKLKREMEQYGPVKSVKLVYDKFTEKPRGYGFVEFEHERDMKTAYKHADGRKIDGRRILVDVERGRTVKDWKPRKCGGGLGSSRKDRPKKTPAEKAEQRRYEAAQAARAARMAAAATSSVPPANSAVRARYEGKDDDRPSYRRDDDRGSRDDRRRDDRGGDNDRSRSSRGDDYGGSRGDYSGSRGGYDDYRGGGGGGGGGGGSRYDDYRR